MPLEKLDRALVLLCSRAGAERAEISSSAGSRIDLAQVEPVFARLELANHCARSFCDCRYADARRWRVQAARRAAARRIRGPFVRAARRAAALRDAADRRRAAPLACRARDRRCRRAAFAPQCPPDASRAASGWPGATSG